jgi:hypothetical protein
VAATGRRSVALSTGSLGTGLLGTGLLGAGLLGAGLLGAGLLGAGMLGAGLLTGSQNGSGNGGNSEVACVALAAAANRLRKAWLDAAPAGSYDTSSSGAAGHGAGPSVV